MDGLRHFTIRGIDLALPAGSVQGRLAQALETGRYENTEAAAVEKHLRPGDRFVDFGAGIGYLASLAARLIGAEAVTGVEAGPSTIALARQTLERNGFSAAGLIHAAVTAAEADGEAEFVIRRNFWASGLKTGANGPGQAEVIRVPSLSAERLLARLQPTVLSCDIEGAELDVLRVAMPASLRLIITEIHPASYGPEGTKRIFDALSAQGFAYEAEGSRGATVVFRRIGAP